ncbi:hypothetical protein [Opitutus sp. GAS368]|jgi:hypothetical protein|uniref:hypothetical protein n=1 Tax=Opitutus sp. GAS368 TaxID=1882749 RepID=UPI00087C461D|nr:hypothetical protein [Opitutus sp. GAS368]SDR65472.1 hypothetical protein SAMN05444173_0060 [Opitutus sp. GAS368]
MQLKLKRIAPLQAGKMLAAFYGLLSLLFVPFMLLFMAMGSFAARQQGGGAMPALPFMFGMGVGFMVLLPFFYAAMGFVFGVISAAVYNLLAKWIGGLELEFEPNQPPLN